MHDELIHRFRPRGWKVIHTRRKTELLEAAKKAALSGKMRKTAEQAVAVADASTKTIFVPKISDAASLLALFHEFGHVHLEHWGRGTSTMHQEEYEAERWAFHTLRTAGIVIPRWCLVHSRAYIRTCIEADERAGKKIHAPARRYAAAA